MTTSAVWQHRGKLSWGAVAAATTGIVLLVFFAFSQWIEFTPGTSGFSVRGVQNPNDSTRTITRSTPTFRPGAVYYYSSIDTFPYTLPIGGASILLALAGWTAATSAVRGVYDRARLKRASLLAFAAVGIGFGGAAWFLFSMWWEDYGASWLDAGFYGLTFGGGTAAVLLWILARAAQPGSTEASSRPGGSAADARST